MSESDFFAWENLTLPAFHCPKMIANPSQQFPTSRITTAFGKPQHSFCLSSEDGVLPHFCRVSQKKITLYRDLIWTELASAWPPVVSKGPPALKRPSLSRCWSKNCHILQHLQPHTCNAHLEPGIYDISNCFDPSITQTFPLLSFKAHANV